MKQAQRTLERTKMRKINASRNSTYIEFDPFVSLPSRLRLSEKVSPLQFWIFPLSQSPTLNGRLALLFRYRFARARCYRVDFVGPRVPRVPSSVCMRVEKLSGARNNVFPICGYGSDHKQDYLI